MNQPLTAPITLVITRGASDDSATRLVAHLAEHASWERVLEVVADSRLGLEGSIAGKPVRNVTAPVAELDASLLDVLGAPLTVVLAADVVPRGDVVEALVAALGHGRPCSLGRVQAATDSVYARFAAREESSDAPASASAQTWSAVAIRTPTLCSVFAALSPVSGLTLTEVVWGVQAAHERVVRAPAATVVRRGPVTAEDFYALAFERGARQARIARNQSGWAPMHAGPQIEFYKHASLEGVAKVAKSRAAAFQKGVRSGFSPLAVDASAALFHEAALRAGQLSVETKRGERTGLLMVPDYRYSNPYQAMLYRRLPSAGIAVEGTKRLTRLQLLRHRLRTRYLHVHWLAGLADVADERSVEDGIALLRLAKQLGYVLLWTVHNEVAHDAVRPDLDARLRDALAHAADRIIVHERGSIGRMASKYGLSADRFLFIPHGTYEGVYRPAPDEGRGLRHRLGIPDGAFCCGLIGQIRGYKGFLEFVEAWRDHADPSWHLLVAGKANEPELAQSLEAMALEQRNFHLRLGRIANDDMAKFLGAADVAVMPYRKILNSGSALLATTLARPIVAPAVGALTEMYADYPGLASLYDPDLPLTALVPTLRERTERHQADRAKEHHAFMEAYSWDRIGEAFVRDCKRVG